MSFSGSLLRPVLLASVLCALSQAIAYAETSASLAEKAGLLGVWAIDCAKSPSPDNYYVTYEARSDGEVRALHFNGRRQDVARVDKIQVPSPRAIAMHILYSGPGWDGTNNREFNVVFEFRDGRMVTLQDVRADGFVTVKDGRYPLTGTPALIYEKCVVRPVA